ncbi:hypothetical protein [Rhodohalobacter sulfatireducens]|nr:hypothetical protein [Rhodohalobacter sulfatireducens]
MNRNVVGCSVSREYLPTLKKLQLTAYFYNKSSFTPLQKFSSNLTKNSFGLIKTKGHEYVSYNAIKPLDNIQFTIEELFEYSVHGMNDSNFVITLKILTNYLKYRLHRFIGSPAIQR